MENQNSEVEGSADGMPDAPLLKKSVAVEKIRGYIKNEILNDPNEIIAVDQDLLLSGLLDSINVVRLVAYLESECNISIPPEDVILEHFGSLEKIDSYLCSRGL